MPHNEILLYTHNAKKKKKKSKQIMTKVGKAVEN